MSSLAMRWPVVITVGLEGDSLEPAVAAAHDAFFALCTTVDASQVRATTTSTRNGDAEPGQTVTASTAVVEVYPDHVTMHTRIRPADTDGIVAEVVSSVVVGPEVTKPMRDEFIALAQEARHYH